MQKLTGMALLLLGAQASLLPAQIFGVGDSQLPGPRVEISPETIQELNPLPQIDHILAKIDADEPLTEGEFIEYIEALEEHPQNKARILHSGAVTASEEYPAKGWAMIATRLHDGFNGSEGRNDDRAVDFGLFRLFLDGSENQDWKTIDRMHSKGPSEMIDSEGKLVRVTHIYAAVASQIMRGDDLGAEFIHQANTTVGDLSQPPTHWVVGAKRMAEGLWHGSEATFEQGKQQFASAASRASAEELRADRLGNLARRFLRNNRSSRLSEAIRFALGNWES